MSRSWLPHPARTIRPQHNCDLPRYATLPLAMAALTHGLAPTPQTAVACQQCGGAHHQPSPPTPGPRKAPKMTTQHVVMWSGGITSWATARHVIAEHGTASVTLLFADTLIEDEDLYTFNEQASAQLGVPITRVADGRDPWQVFEDKRWLGNTRIAQCSHALKQEPCRDWLVEHTDPADTVLYVGIDWTETERLPGIVRGWAPWTVSAPLTRPPYRDKAQLLNEAQSAGLLLPRLYDLGFAHNNCGGACVKGGQAQWTRLLEVFPERFAHVEAFEQRMRDRLGKDVSILRDRRGGTTKPLPLAELRQRIERRKHEQPDLFSILDAEPDDEIDTQDMGGCGCFTDAA